ncbi:MAG: phosphonate ABC transporter, permease protein PhnE [Myxococcales bacterium]|nr:phosphonate ABC transporter, permease protein PhnE [Myxococcales bacterium]
MTQRTWQPPRLIAHRGVRAVLAIAVAGYLAVVLGTLQIDVPRLLQGLTRGQQLLAGFTPPDFVTRSDAIVDGVLESLWMTVASTVVGVAVSVPVALGASSNLSPRPLYAACRALIAITRSFQEVILAVFAVALFGFGPFAGFVTLVVATVGFFAKLLAEDIEDLDPAPAEAIRATGAGFASWLAWGVWPQIIPRFVGLALYRLDINFRESAIVGIVGGGGIGATLNTAFDRYEYDSAAAILLVIIAIVLVVEASSGAIRRRVQ